jgi:hypothetical protein
LRACFQLRQLHNATLRTGRINRLIFYALWAALGRSITIANNAVTRNEPEFDHRVSFGWAMPLTAECPFCAILIKDVPDEQDGQEMDCPRCGKPFRVAGRASSSKNKKTGTSAQTKALKANPYPTHKEMDAAKKKAREQKVRDEQEAEHEEPVRKAAPKRSEPEEEEKTSSGLGIPWFVILGVIAFLSGSIGLAMASFAGMELIAVGVTFLGLVLAFLGFFIAFRKEEGTLYPLLGVVVCLPALLWSGYCYSQAPKPEKPRSQAELSKKTIVPLNQRNAALSDEKPTAAQPDEFVDFTKQGQQQGDLRVAVTSATITKAPLEGPKNKKAPTEKYLVIQLRLSNVGVEKKYDYAGWGQWGSDHAATLRDTKGKVFKIKRFDASWEIKGQVRSTAVFPGKSVDDVIVFEAPPLKDLPSRLRLELPAAAFGGTGAMQFEIPGKAINISP